MYNSIYKVETESVTFDAKKFIRPGLTENDITQIKEVFDAFDADGDGLLNPADIRNALLKFGYKASSDTVLAIMSVHDEEEQGALNFINFINMCSRYHNQKGETKNHIRSIFLKYDKTKRGYFDINDLKRVAKELGETVEDEMLEEMILSMDSDLNGQVTFEDFYNAMSKKIF